MPRTRRPTRHLHAPAMCLLAAAALPLPAHAAADLTSLSLEQLLEVTIVGASKYDQKQGDVAAAVSVVTRQEIKAFGWRTLGEALASLPGVHTTYDRQYVNLGVRGFGLPGDFTTRLLVTLDGNRVNNPGYDGGPVGQEFPVDVDLIERIEFIPGPGGAVYGQNAMVGVVNVVTRRGVDVGGGELAVAVQQPLARREARATWGRLLDNGVDVLLSVSAMRARGEDHFYDFGAAAVSGVAHAQDGERSGRFLARAAVGAWTFQFAFSDRHKDDPTAGYHSDPLVPGQYQADGYTLTQLQYQRALADTLQLSARLFVGEERYTSMLSYGTPLLFLQPSEWRGGELRLVSTALTGHILLLGLEGQDNVRNGQSVLDLAQPANDLNIPASGHRIGLYAQDEWHIADSLTATLGLRLDRNQAGATASSPRAALIWQASPANAFKLLYGRAHRAPNFFESQYYDGVSQVANPRLQGETIDTAELTADHRVDRDLTLRASVYRWTMQDLVTQGTDPVTGLLQFQSGETVQARGLELSADRTWAGGARLRGNVALQRTAHVGGASLPNSPRLLGRLNLSGPLPFAGLRLGYELRYDGRRFGVDGALLGGYAVSNLHLSLENLPAGLELSVASTNLFGKRYAQPGSNGNWQSTIRQDGRGVQVKLGFAF